VKGLTEQLAPLDAAAKFFAATMAMEVRPEDDAWADTD
jgi:hypothetical protein